MSILIQLISDQLCYRQTPNVRFWIRTKKNLIGTSPLQYFGLLMTKFAHRFHYSLGTRCCNQLQFVLFCLCLNVLMWNCWRNRLSAIRNVMLMSVNHHHQTIWHGYVSVLMSIPHVEQLWHVFLTTFCFTAPLFCVLKKSSVWVQSRESASEIYSATRLHD